MVNKHIGSNFDDFLEEEKMNKEAQKELTNIVAELRADRKKRLEQLKETIDNHNPEALFADGFDDCLAGFDTKGRAVYFANEIIATLMERDDMSEEDALEYFGFNIEGAYVGEFTPIYMWEE